MLFEQFSSHSSYEQNLKLIASSRLVLWCFAQCFLVIDHLYLKLEFDFLLAQVILTLLPFSAVLTFFYLFKVQEASERSVKFQLISDALIMTIFFHITGGAANPFVSLLLFPLMISAAILSAQFSWFMVLITLSCFGSLYFPELNSTDNTEFSHQAHHHHVVSDQSAFSLHMIGMWFNFALSAILISIFIVRMRSELEKQKARLNLQREQALRNEQLLGIATQAASAAHHMSTPLSTMSILVEDMISDAQNEVFKEDLNTLRTQLSNCKGVLKKLRHQAQQDKKTEDVKAFIDQLADEFRLLHPGTPLNYEFNCDQDKTLTEYLESDPSLRMALLNILNNAAEASPDKVHLTAGCDHQKLLIEITDYGKPASSFKDKLHQSSSGPVSTTKSEGMGIGLFLSHATINRHHGQISLIESEREGNCIRIVLPTVEQKF